MSGSGQSPILGCRLFTVSSHSRGKKLIYDSYKSTNPIHEGSTFTVLSKSNHLSKAPLPNTITMGLTFWHMNFEGIQCLVHNKIKDQPGKRHNQRQQRIDQEVHQPWASASNAFQELGDLYLRWETDKLKKRFTS